MAKITQANKDNFKGIFDNLIDDLARTVTIHLDPKQEFCPNCDFSPGTNRSSHRYTTTNPNTLGGPLNKKFRDGTRCPVCRGSGKLFTPRNQSVEGTIAKNIEEFESIIRQIGRVPQNLIKLRTKLTTIQVLREAKKAAIDGLIYRKVMPPITQGLGDLMFVKTFWEQEGKG